LRMAWRILHLEIDLAKRTLNAELFRDGVVQMFIGTEFPRTTAPGRGYRSDGSHTQAPNDRPLQPLAAVTGSRQVLPGYLRYDLERLVAVQSEGTAIVLYESPIAPGSRPNTDVARTSRAEFVADCRAVGLECYTAPEQSVADAKDWPDSNHAPPAALGRYLTQLLGGRLNACRP
jgi:hypothetical protein